ncbi:MAG TPA: hypothetical protein VFY87_32235, partial [Geminicoccaceae bacterium]|nr:hypothetical protein [Geminicoccaceae bacterium]
GTDVTFTDSDGRRYTIEFGKYGQPGETGYRAFYAATHHFLESARVCDGGTCYTIGSSRRSANATWPACAGGPGAAARTTTTTTGRSWRSTPRA